MLKLAYALVLILSATFAHADDRPYDQYLIGVRFEKNRAIESVGLDFGTKALYKFTNFEDMEIHHALLVGVDLLSIPNVDTMSSGEYVTRSLVSPYLGLRVFNTVNNLVGDLVFAHVSQKELMKGDEVGGMFRFGYMFPYKTKADGNTRFLNMGMTYRFGFKKADKLTSEPDIFNGLGFTVAFLL